MAKPLVFQFADQSLSYSISKVERQKLYGYKETEVLDEHGQSCELATLADDGRTVVGRGGTGIGYLSADGHWCDKGLLTPVNLEGEEITAVASSFDAAIELTEKVSVDEYLDHNVRLVYVLTTEDDDGPLRQQLEAGAIYSFRFNYRAGLEPDTGFLLMNQDGDVFMTVGKPTRIEFLELQQTPAFLDEEGDIEETDLMDFDMI